MIPVLAVPVLNRYDLFWRMLATVDVTVRTLIVIDNGGGMTRGDIDAEWADEVRLFDLGANIGVAASWNLAMKTTAREPWWAFINHDIEFARGDLAGLADRFTEPGPLVATLDGFAAFGMNRAALDAVGYFDENYHPAYCEDADMEWRCKVAKVPIVQVPAGLLHERSSTIAAEHYRVQNARTYPENVSYFVEKWGGHLRGGERYDSPFDLGGGVEEWTLDPARLRRLGWETTMRDPRGDELR